MVKNERTKTRRCGRPNGQKSHEDPHWLRVFPFILVAYLLACAPVMACVWLHNAGMFAPLLGCGGAAAAYTHWAEAKGVAKTLSVILAAWMLASAIIMACVWLHGAGIFVPLLMCAAAACAYTHWAELEKEAKTFAAFLAAYLLICTIFMGCVWAKQSLTAS